MRLLVPLVLLVLLALDGAQWCAVAAEGEGEGEGEGGGDGAVADGEAAAEGKQEDGPPPEASGQEETKTDGDKQVSEGKEESGREGDAEQKEGSGSEQQQQSSGDQKEKTEETGSKSPFVSYDAPVIETTEGKVRGSVLLSRNGRTIYAYQGIPYAKPPVGELRFKPPQRAEAWEGVRDATRERSECTQLKFPTRELVGREDCLYLNVYTTRLPVNDSVVGKVIWDVVVLIHGGGFTHGSGHFDDYSPEHLLDEHMVLVTFNYRLGPFGFLATDDEASPGNYGLKDQLDALRWVRRNIERFSGNPQSVSLLGFHAGAASAHLHLLSPLSQELFHGVISVSGTALSPWALVPGAVARRRAFRLGELMGCKVKGDDAAALVKCLRRKQPQELAKQTSHVTEWLHDMHYPFVPVIEPTIKGKKAFIPKDPVEMMKDLKDRKILIPWIMGVAANEGLPQALQTMVFRATLNQLNENPTKYLPQYLEMSIEPQSKAEAIAKKAWDFYVKNDTLTYGNLIKLAEITTDYNYFHGVVKSVDLHTEASKAAVFVYHFSFHIRDPRFTLGVPQGDDIRYLFPDRIGGIKVEYEEAVFPTVDRLVKLVHNFARDGDPTPEEIDLLNNVLWPLAEGRNFEYIDIGDNITIVSDGFYSDRMAFWDSIDKEFNEQPHTKDEL
ncbi:hypothetical protein R5R35_006695 [Gryllus longicercus]|uniref:Carboxylesterase type B domain-containing protein n=1 Tax=Gryllus longicercus TaxID=2509291 RepID=A0AAN9W1G3_9ORTH